ncbi:DUF1566 domain-containing protein, partial [bacterium]|nr:DUF1566 domain-containing protein [bacterium]
TGLMWEKGGSEEEFYYNFDTPLTYINYLNRFHFYGYKDWRVPTIEELKSLLEQQHQEELYFINEMFDEKSNCLSADKNPVDNYHWIVCFITGCV